MTDNDDAALERRFTIDQRLEEVVGELYALLKGTNYKMAEGDVEFFPGGEELGQLEVDIRGRRYRITVEDIGNSASRMAREVFGIQEQQERRP